MRKYDNRYIEAYPKRFYTRKDGSKYPYLKEDIDNEIDIFVPATFMGILKDFDIPFIENEWIFLLIKRIGDPDKYNRSLFGQYLALMKLAGFRHYRFEDGDRINEAWSRFKNNIPIKDCKYTITLERSENWDGTKESYEKIKERKKTENG